jgi:hypothetical protein
MLSRRKPGCHPARMQDSKKVVQFPEVQTGFRVRRKISLGQGFTDRDFCFFWGECWYPTSGAVGRDRYTRAGCPGRDRKEPSGDT